VKLCAKNKSFPGTWSHPATGHEYSKIGVGTSIVAYERDGELAKVAMDEIHWNGFMPVKDELKRTTLVFTTAHYIERLRNSPAFAKWKHVLPPTWLLDPELKHAVLMQTKQTGEFLSTLSGAPLKRAKAELAELLAAAKAVDPDVVWDTQEGNLRFDKTGRLTGWFDVVNPWWVLAADRGEPSRGGSQALMLEIGNLGDHTLRIDWLDVHAQPITHGTAAPGKIFRNATYAGHRWRVTDVVSGKIITEFTATQRTQPTI
jgi:hypothetical protein